MGTNAPDNPFNNKKFTGEFDTPQIARKSYEAWFLKQQPTTPAGARTQGQAVKQPWEMTFADYATKTQTSKTPTVGEGIRIAYEHKKSVEQALANNKPVPAAVLAEYPELQKPPQSATLPSMAEKQAARDNIEKTDITQKFKPLIDIAKNSKNIEEFSGKLQEIKQWGEQRHRTKDFPQLSSLPGELERYNKWYKNLSPEKKTLEDLYNSYRDIPNRGITINDFYNQAKQSIVPQTAEEGKGIPKKLEQLAKEARKYKTAEDFFKAKKGDLYFNKELMDLPIKEPKSAYVGSKNIKLPEIVRVYRGGVGNKLLPGDFVTIDPKRARLFARGEGKKVSEFMVKRSDLGEIQSHPDKNIQGSGEIIYAPNGIKSLVDFFNQSQSSFNPPAPKEGGAKKPKFETLVLTESTSKEYLSWLKKQYAGSTGKYRQKISKELKSYKSKHKSAIQQEAELNRPLPDKVADEYRKEEWMQDYLVRNNEIALPEAKKSTPAKQQYTSIPKEWHNVDLMDWGKKGLRRKGDGKGKKNIFPDDQQNLEKLPSRTPRATMKRIKELAGGEFWSVNSMKNPTYYLAPKRVVEQVKAELGESAFERTPFPERSPKQKINDLILQAKAHKNVENWQIGKRIREIAVSRDIPENDLTETQKNYIKEYDEALNDPDISERIRAEMEREISPAAETPDLDPDKLTDEQWLAIQTAQKVDEQIDGIFDDLEESETPQKDMFGTTLRPDLQGGVSGKQKEMFSREDYKTEQAKQADESARLDTAGQMKLPEKGKIYSSLGATKSPELDRALQKAVGLTRNSYVSLRNGKWFNSKQKPAYGGYYEISNGNSKYEKGQTFFTIDKEAIKAAKVVSYNTKNPVFIEITNNGYNLVDEQPQKRDFVKVMPKGAGLTRDEIALLGDKMKIAEAEIAQEEGKKVGYKTGVAEAISQARQKLGQFRLAVQLTDKHRQDAIDIVKQYIPKEEQYKYTKRILNAKTSKRIDDLTQAINVYLNKAERRQVIRNFRNFIKELRSKYRLGETPFGKLRNDVRTRLLDVLNKYGTSKLSENKRDILESRQEYIQNVSGSVADAFESLEESGKDILQMPNARIEELNRLRKTHIGELDPDEIRYIHSSLDHLIKIAEKKGEIKEQIRAEKIGKLVNQARGEVYQKTKEYGIVKETQGAVGFIKQLYSIAQATPHTLIGYLTGKDNTATVELVVKNLKNMTKEKHRIAKDFILSYRKMLDDAGIIQKDTDMLSDKMKIVYGGKTFTADVGSVLSIYMDTQAEGNLSRVLKTGRVFDVYKYDVKKLFIKVKNQIHTNRPSLEELRTIIDYVENKNPVLKKMADVYFEHNYKVQTPVVNKTSMAYQNYELARKEKYWHISRMMPMGIEGKKTDISVSIENQGRFLPRTGGKQPLRVIPFQQEVISNMQANAAYASMTMPMRDVKALVSDERWQKQVLKSGQGKELRTLITLLRRIQGQITDKDFIDLAGSGLLNNFGKYALSLRLSGYGVQTASIPAAFEVIEPEYFRSARSIASLPKVPIGAIKEMMDLSPTLWMRWTARQFDFVIGGVAAQHAFNGLVWGNKPITEKTLNHYTWGDQKAIYQLYISAQDKIAAETDLKRGTLEFKKKAIELTEDAIETQPVWDMIYRNELTSSSNVVLRGSLMFQAARSAQYNVLLRAFDDYKKGRIGAGEAGTRISGVVYANILVALVKRLVKMGVKYSWLGLLFLLGDDDKKEKVKIAAPQVAIESLKQLPIDSALNLISLPAFGEISQNIAYETIKRIKYPYMTHQLQDIRTGNIFADLSLDATGVVADTGVMASHIITGEKFKSGPDKDKLKWKRDAKQVADELAELIAMRWGLPYSAPKGEIYYSYKSAEGLVKKSLTESEIIAEIKKKLRKEGGYERILIGTNAAGKKLYRKGRYMPAGTPHKDEEDKVRELRAELAKRRNK